MNIDKKLKEFDEFIFEEARGCDCDSRDEKKCIFAKELNGKCNCYCHSVHNRNKDTRNFLRQALKQQQQDLIEDIRKMEALGHPVTIDDIIYLIKSK